MINAHHSSRPGGTKKFMLGGEQLGWRAIIEMFGRGCECVKNGNAQMIH